LAHEPRERALRRQVGERGQLGDGEQVAAAAEHPQPQLAAGAEAAAAPEADAALVGGEGAGERVDASARDLVRGRADGEAELAAVDRLGGLAEDGANVGADRRIGGRSRARARADQVEQPYEAVRRDAGADVARRLPQAPLLARRRRPGDDLDERLLLAGEVGELAEHEAQRVGAVASAERKPVRPGEDELRRGEIGVLGQRLVRLLRHGQAGPGGRERPLDETGRHRARHPEAEAGAGAAGGDLPGELRLAGEEPGEARAQQVVQGTPEQFRTVGIDVGRDADREQPRALGETALAQPDQGEATEQ